MSYQLESFTHDCHNVLKRDSGPQGREQVRVLFEKLLGNDDFVHHYCADVKPGLYVLFEDQELKFQVLAHVNEKARVSPPHDHGDSWAIYGQAIEFTDITEWARTDDGSKPNHAKLVSTKSYRMLRGQAAIFQDGAIHSIAYPNNSCFVRVTGTNLDQIARNMFDLKTGAVKQMTPQRSS